MKEWEVTIPIAAHAFLTIEAETEEEAIEKGLAEASLQDVEEWTSLRQFHQGNVVYCPHPWEAEARCIGTDDE